MFDHVTIRVSDREASRRFYETLLEREPEGSKYLEWDEFGIAQADGEHPVTRKLHVGFAAESREEVDDFWRRGVEAGYESDPPTGNVHLAFPVPTDAAVGEFHRVATAPGYRDNGAPGERPDYHPATSAPSSSIPRETTSRR
jgi:catechol 2,3-dioxygenase-like lactoylglutathione lyase family enzyme